MKIDVFAFVLGVLGYFITTALSGNTWESWKLKYGKVYSNHLEEVNKRLIWQRQLNYVLHHNNRSDKLFTLHMNQFADHELVTRRTIYHSDDHSLPQDTDVAAEFPVEEAPTSFDWRSKGVIGPVFSYVELDIQAVVAAESVASLHAIALGTLYELSSYEIAECGCGGHLLIKDIFYCIHDKIGELCTNQSYHVGTGTCNKENCTEVAQVNGTRFIPFGDEDEMGEAILEVPLMVYIDASRPSFMMYHSGIYVDPKCSKSSPDHILQVVGYGQTGDRKYWICRNSWGVDWGLQGYILIERGTNMCGIASRAIYPY